MVQRVDLAIATVDTTCVEVVVGKPIKVVTEGDENATTDAVEFVVIGWGKKTPFWRGTVQNSFSSEFLWPNCYVCKGGGWKVPPYVWLVTYTHVEG